MGYKDKKKEREAKNAYQRRWKKANPEKANANQRRYREKHKLRLRKERMQQFETNPKKMREPGLRRKFGITFEYYLELSAKQTGVCAICRNPETFIDKRTGIKTVLTVDHNHTTGKLRGLLCRVCNTTLGKIQENKETIRNMLSYLEFHEPENILPKPLDT